MSLLIVDDHAPFREFLRAMLGGAGFGSIAEVADGESAIETARQLHPEWAIVDIQLGDGIDGFEVARRLAELPSPPCVICISSRAAAEFGSRLDEAPIQAFMPKEELSVEALHQIFQPRTA